jgi:hypothetical protein
MRETASVGAGLTVVIWGCIHAQAQALTALARRDRRRGAVLSVGLLLPSVSVINAGSCLGLWGVWKFYFAGDYGSWHYAISHILALIGKRVSPELRAALWPALPWVGGAWRAPSVTFMLLLARPVVIQQESHGVSPDIDQAGPSGFIEALMTLVSVMAVPSLPLLAICYFGWLFFYSLLALDSDFYIIGGYFASSNHLESCFFMPCAPQSISETDWAGALFAGIVLFVGVEIVVPWYQTTKERYRSDEAFRESINRRMATDSRRRLSDGNAADVEEGITLNNSGSLVEEGFAMVQLSRGGTGNTLTRLNDQGS